MSDLAAAAVKRRSPGRSLLAFLALVCSTGVGQAQATERLLVVPFNPIDVPEAAAESVCAAFETALGKTGAFTVIRREEVVAALASRWLGPFGCTSERCAAELGESLSAAVVVRGQLAAREGGYALGVSVRETVAGRTIYLDEVWARTLEEMQRSMELFAFKAAGLTVTDGKETRIARRFGQVFVETAPSRTDIYVNGVRKGVSPDLFTRAPLGKVLISAQRGILYGEKLVDITESLSQVRIDLSETYGSLLIVCRENLDVFLDGLSLGPLGAGRFDGLTVGIHTLELRGEGLYWSDEVAVRARERTMIVALPLPYGAIEYVIPVGAAAEIRGSGFREVVTGYGSLPAPAGEYTVIVSGPEYETLAGVVVSVGTDATATLRPQLNHSADYDRAAFTLRLDEAARTMGYGYKLTAGDIARLRALRQEIEQSPHRFPDLLERADSLVGRADRILASEGAALPGATTAGSATADPQLNGLFARRLELEAQIENLKLARKRRAGAGWISFGAGAAGGGLAVLFRYLSNAAFRDYQTAETWEEAQRKEDQVRLWDICTIAAIGTGGVCLAVSAVLWASGPSTQGLRRQLDAVNQDIESLSKPRP